MGANGTCAAADQVPLAMVDASVVIPARNAEATLGRTLRCLERQRYNGTFEVIVVDAGSTDRTAEVAAAASLPVRVLNAGELGPGEARNAGVADARGAAIAFTDADCFPSEGWLAAGVDALGRAELVQGAVRADPEAARHPFDRTVWVVAEAGLYECASLFVRRSLFERLGGFEEWLRARIGKPLAEDVWFGWRARRGGAVTTFCADAAVAHAVFSRSAGEYVRERLRLVYFPAIVRKIPELRRSLLWGRAFMTTRTASFDLGIASGAVAAALGSVWPLLGTAPYWALLGRQAAAWGRRAALVAAVELIADATGFASLALGSLRARTFVL